MSRLCLALILFAWPSSSSWAAVPQSSEEPAAGPSQAIASPSTEIALAAGFVPEVANVQGHSVSFTAVRLPYRYVSLGVSLDWATLETDSRVNYHYRLHSTQAAFVVRGRAPLTKWFEPHATLGIGYAFVSLIERTNVRCSYEDGISGSWAIGFRTQITKGLGLGADVSQRPAAPAGACANVAAGQQKLPPHYMTTWSLVGSLRF
jgi:hypothetical protein